MIKRFLNYFTKDKPAKETPMNLEKIPWNQVVKKCYDKNLNFAHPVSKIIYLDDKTERAVILKKPEGLFTLTFEKLYPFDDEELKYLSLDLHGYWSQNTCKIYGIFDTEENAINTIFSVPPFKYNKSI